MVISIDELTKREKELLSQICKGKSNKNIADHLDISPNTVRRLEYRTYKKLGVGNRFQAILWSLAAPQV